MSERFDFVPSELKRGMAIAKIVRPISNDFVVRIDGRDLILFSNDKRRMVVSRVPAVRGETERGTDEYYVPFPKSSLFLSDGEVAIATADSDLMKVRIRGNGKSRQASFKRRSVISKRTRIPGNPEVLLKAVNANSFSCLLKAVSCSAMVRHTKTEEEMRVNQVHFYGDFAFSSTRYHASMASLSEMDLDLSIVSSDIPAIRAFCSRIVGDEVHLGQDATRLWVVDPETKSALIISRVVSVKPEFSPLDQSGFKLEFKVSRVDFQKGFNWASMAIEGTQRATMSVDSSLLRLIHEGEEILSIPVNGCTGDMRADFPVGVLAMMAGYVESDTAVFRFMHKEMPTILEVTGDSEDVWRAHYVQSMKSR